MQSAGTIYVCCDERDTFEFQKAAVSFQCQLEHYSIGITVNMCKQRIQTDTITRYHIVEQGMDQRTDRSEQSA